jgi:hypothetical protein
MRSSGKVQANATISELIYTALASTANDHPQLYKEAMASTQKSVWEAAITDKATSIECDKTFTIVDDPQELKRYQPIGSTALSSFRTARYPGNPGSKILCLSPHSKPSTSHVRKPPEKANGYNSSTKPQQEPRTAPDWL